MAHGAANRATGWRVPPARAEERIVWPVGFGPRFVVFVDVEEEFDWRAPLDRRHVGTAAMRAFPAAHRRFADRGIGLSCMVDYPIATDPAATAILREVAADGRSTIGTQLHAWVNPPFGHGAESYPGNLPAALEAAKLDRLTDAIVAAFGQRPIAYRAGRYGIGPRTLRLLASRGYRLDASIRSRYDYRADGGPDFSRMAPDAFRRDGVLALPLTTIFTGALHRQGEPLYRLARRVPLGRAVAARSGLLQRVALTPEGMPAAAAIAAVDRALADGVGVLSLSFHSPTLEPGHTPYVRDAADLAAFHRWWELLLDHLAQRGVRPTTPDELLAAAGLSA